MSIKLYSPEYLFPTKIVKSSDTDFKSNRDDMSKWMIDYSYKNKTYARSNFGGYQSPDNFYLEESFAPYLNRLTDHIMCTLEHYLDDPNVSPPIEDLKLSNMWFNFNYENSYNVTHVHPGSVLAVVLFLHVPEDSGELIFEADNQWAHALVNSDSSKGILPEEGGLILFPSYLPHRVTANENKNNEMRVSMAFNLADLPIPPVS